MRIRWLKEGILGLREVKVEGEVGSFKHFELGAWKREFWKRELKYDGKGYSAVFAPRWTGPFVVHPE